jgi:hypothetical protein
MASEKAKRILFWLHAMPKALCGIAQGRHSALWGILQSCHSTLCRIARSLKKRFILDSMLCHLVWNSCKKFSC